MKYKANVDFINPIVRKVVRDGKEMAVSGNVRAADICEGKGLDDLETAGYLTKVIDQKPAPTKNKTTKKTTKKAKKKAKK